MPYKTRVLDHVWYGDRPIREVDGVLNRAEKDGWRLHSLDFLANRTIIVMYKEDVAPERLSIKEAYQRQEILKTNAWKEIQKYLLPPYTGFKPYANHHLTMVHKKLTITGTKERLIEYWKKNKDE